MLQDKDGTLRKEKELQQKLLEVQQMQQAMQ